MSNEKKNKGRDPEVRGNDSRVSRLVDKFLGMVETDYMRCVVIPVLEAEGYKKIDFHHGQSEIGKDLIFFKDQPFSKKSLSVAVVKSEKLTKASSNNLGFPVILVQLDQAASNEVVSWDGDKRLPDEVLLILADDPSHDVITANSGSFQRIGQKGVKVITGSDVARSLIENRPDIADQILQSNLDVAGYFNSNSTNIPLLHALHTNETVDVRTIFTDLDSAVGSITMSQALSFRASGVNDVEIGASAWIDASRSLIALESCLGRVLKTPLPDVEMRYAEINKIAQSKENVNLWQGIEKVVLELRQWSAHIRSEIDGRTSAITSQQNNHVHAIGGSLEKRGVVLDILRDLKKRVAEVGRDAESALSKVDVEKNLGALSDSVKNLAKELSSAKTEIFKINKEKNTDIDGIDKAINEVILLVDIEFKNTKKFASKVDFERLRSKKYVPEKNYEISVDDKSLNEKLLECVDSLVRRFGSPEVEQCADYARSVLLDAKRYLEAINSIVSDKNLTCILRRSSEVDEGRSRLGACILGLLDSGLDVLLTGNAGSGKSTTLEMFARRRFENRKKDEEVIFIPLAKVIAPPVDSPSHDELSHFFEEVARVFKVSQPGITAQYVRERVNGARRVILVLDGVDEAFSLVSWLSAVIDVLRSHKGDQIQVIASSRFPVAQMEARGFINIQLLPFRPQQVRKFVRDFLKENEVLAEDVIKHLEANKNMFAVAKTPLMSTILCVLAKNGVTLPSTMNALYRERFELLWGAYDAKKQVSRVKSRKVCLEDVSKKIAYYLHGKHIRSASRHELESYVVESLERKYNPTVVASAFHELERPCNVLLEEAGEGDIGFGHLSFQEYLVSEELYTNRQSEIVNHLADPWWRNTLVLIAMRTEDVGNIIEDRIVQAGMIGDASETLRAMIEVSGPGQRHILEELLKHHSELDALDGIDDVNYVYEEDLSFDGERRRRAW